MANFVDIESPYMASNQEELKRNIRYARACVRDSLLKDEIPFASHLFYTQPGILDDNIPDERERGIMAGKEMTAALNATTVVYTDLGITAGMEKGIKLAREKGRNVIHRTLGENWEEEFAEHERNHSHNESW
ncbi:MAG: hypothetical protein IIA87_04910 [Nanoarchaeota archaeon]|nr:hypothetical protein [Nanoarchaeota archaeon]